MSMKANSSVLGCCKSQKRSVILIFILSVIVFFAGASVGFLLLNSNPRTEPTLKFLSIINRHGERAPIFTYPFDPYQNESFWPDGFHQLLQKGKFNLLRLGKFLRHRYDGFLPPQYKPTHVLVKSSEVDRCLMTAELLLAGLYPPVGNQIWNEDLLWQPIPVHSTPSAFDDIIRVKKSCALLSKEQEYVETNFLQEKLKENQNLINYLTKNTGLQFKTVELVSNLYDNLMITERQGLKLPEWTRYVYPEKLKPLFLIHNLQVFDTPTMMKLRSGVFINELLSNMNKKKSSEDFERRLNLYSVHDTTIVHYWRGMNISQELNESPDYGAAIFIELHEINGKYRVKMLYKLRAADDEMIVLNIRGCENDESVYQDEMCDLDIFSSVLRSTAITNFEKECQIPQ